MSMHSSWFRKPVYKTAIVLAVLTMGGGLAVTWLYGGWIILVFLILVWSAFFALSSYYVQSGVYVHAVCSGNPAENSIAITFDDGPCENTASVLSMLKGYDAKAGFFLIGEKAKKYPEIVDAIDKAGHSIGNHSFYHLGSFPIQSVRKIRKELMMTQEILTGITGKAPGFFRPPFGVTNPLLARALKRFDLITVGWSVRSFDTIGEPPSKILTRVLPKIRPGSIVLFHDTTPEIIKILEEVLLFCREKNLRAVSVDELIHKIKN